MHLVNVYPADVFQALAETTRIRIVRLLATSSEEACLCELVDSLQEPQYKLSRHLKILRQTGVLTAQKEGRWVYHRLVQGAPYWDHLHAVVRSLPDREKAFQVDLVRFQRRMRLRQRGRCCVGIQTRELAVGGLG